MAKVRALGGFGLSLLVLIATGLLSSMPAGSGLARGLEARSPRSPLASDTCAAAPYEIGTLPYTRSSTTTGLADDYNLGTEPALCAGGGAQSVPGTGQGPDAVFKFATDQDCNLNIAMTPAPEVDLALYVLSPDCSDVAGNCVRVDDQGAAGVTDDVDIQANGGRLYYIIVDGYQDADGPFDLTISETTSTGCALIDPAASVSGRVWEDLDGDGMEDAGEPSISGVTVKLYLESGPLVDTTTTNASGLYTFTGLLPHEYYHLAFVLPSGYALTRNEGPNEPYDSTPYPHSGETDPFELGPAENATGWDAGMYRPARIGGRVWEDRNGNGLQEPGEPGLSPNWVELRDCEENDVGDVQTGYDGTYSFSAESPGSYILDIEKPYDWCITERDQGADEALDSDAQYHPSSRELARIACFTIGSGQQQDHWDAGVYEELSLSGRAWHDKDMDGIQDQGEPGIPGIEVGFWLNSTCTGTAHESDTTDANGVYHLPPRCMGTYCLRFAGIPSGWGISPRDRGGDDALDSDADPLTGKIAPLVVGAGGWTGDVGLYERVGVIYLPLVVRQGP